MQFCSSDDSGIVSSTTPASICASRPPRLLDIVTHLLVTKLVTRPTKTALQMRSREPFCLVAGAGFEPATSGL